MATNTLNSIYKINHHTIIDYPPTTTKPTFFPPPPITTNQFFPSITTNHLFSATVTTHSAATAATPSTSQNVSFDLLKQHLSAQNFRDADEETRRLLIALAGEAAEKRGYVFFSEVKFISEHDLKAIDDLWREHSDGKFGYSVQKRIWKKVNKDFTNFFIKVGWMKKLESSEVVQYNYRSFPTEFMWEIEEGTPEGHLPLTNALRGTQLLNSILMHPAFEGDDDGDDEQAMKDEKDNGISSNSSKPLINKLFKTNYTF